MDNPIRLGVVGTGRGKTFMNPSEASGFKLAAICDRVREKAEICKKKFDKDGTVQIFTDFDEMINRLQMTAHFVKDKPELLQCNKNANSILKELCKNYLHSEATNMLNELMYDTQFNDEKRC